MKRFLKRAFYEFAKWTGAVSIVPFLRLKRIYINGKMPKDTLKRPFLVVSNHVSVLDPLVILTTFPLHRIHFIALDTILVQNFAGKMLRALGCIPISRENPRISTFKEVFESFKKGEPACIFPEGKLPTSDDHKIKEFKEGAAFIAAVGKADILPVYMIKRKSAWRRQRVLVGERIGISEFIQSNPPSMDDISTLTKYLCEKEKEMEILSKSYIK